jgi:retinol dehydrogenase-14
MSELASSMKGRTVMITGATSGIGKATAMGLADMGASIVMVGRSSEKLEATREEIAQKTSNEDLETMKCDLSSMGEVRKLAKEYEKRHDKLDVLLNNAGGIMGERMLTADGYEYTFALNHLCPFVLTDQLLDILKATARSRIVTVSSSAHNFGHINFDDIMFEKNWKPFKAYGQAKLANVLFTYELSRRLKGTGTTANCLHPGVVRTGFGTKQKGPSKIGTAMIRPFSIGPMKGARTSIYLASSPQVEGISGRYFVREKEKRSAPETYDEAIAKRLWELSEKLTGIDRR